MIPHPHLLLKHRGGSVLVDSNLLLLWFAGSFKRELVGGYKRLQMFSLEDFDVLVEFLKNFRSIVTSPDILTEVSHLSGALSDPIKREYFATFRKALELLQEEYVPSGDAGGNLLFARLGLTDV